MQPMKSAIAAAIAFAIIWSACNIVAAVFPHLMGTISASMLHASLKTSWHISFAGYLWGLIGWAGFAFLSVFCSVTIYKKL